MTAGLISQPVAIDPAVLLALHAAFPERYPALFESAAPGEPLGRFDILFACPGACLTLRADGTLTLPPELASSHSTAGRPSTLEDASAPDTAGGASSRDSSSRPVRPASGGAPRAIWDTSPATGGAFLATLDEWWLQSANAADVPAEDAAAATIPKPPKDNLRGHNIPGDDIPGNEIDERASLPFTGGWLLYLGYELAGQIEPRLHLEAPVAGPIAQAVRIPAALIYEHATRKAWIVAEQGAKACLAGIAADIDRVPALEAARELLCGEIEEDPPQQYLQAVERALEYIVAGDVYQANLSRGWRASLRHGVRAHHLYQRLRQTNPGPFSGIALIDDMAVISSSPERLVEVRAGKVSMRPIAGTRPRATDPAADRALACELHQHPKERAEHIMLIDLARNDLGRVCRAGTVQVDEYMTIESYTHVHHIVSNIRGVLRQGTTPGAVLAAVFPGGTITGCPKVRCMEIISELERGPRGPYTGSLGYLNRDGSMDLNILIRSLQVCGEELSLRAGAGIVADSIAQRELEESRTKARGVLRALGSNVAMRENAAQLGEERQDGGAWEQAQGGREARVGEDGPPRHGRPLR